MPRKVSFRGNTLVLNDEAPAGLKAGDRVRYTVHDWHEGEHTLSGEVVSLGRDGRVVRIRISAGIQDDVVQEVPVEALTVVNVVPLKGER